MREATPLSRPRESGAVPAARADRRPMRSRTDSLGTDRRFLPGQNRRQTQSDFSGKCIGSWSGSGWPRLLSAALECDQLYLWRSVSAVVNLLDGMVAIEHGKQSQLGVLYNELPDRVSDSVLFVALGYASDLPWLGWLGALLAALTAYIRVFGAALGFAQDFRGPMAKQHRMAALTAGCLISIVEHFAVQTNHSLPITCGSIAAGSLSHLLDAHSSIGAQATGAQLTCVPLF